MKAEIQKVTPELAEKWLGVNTHNRNVRMRLVSQFSGAMKRGEWFLNGESIKFSATGKLLDGQHRLLAVSESGETVEMLVVTGLEDASQETMDTGAKRTMQDILKLRGEVNTPALAATLRLHWRVVNDESVMSRNLAPSVQQLLAWLEEHPDIREATRRGTNLIKSLPGGASSVYSTGIMLCSEKDEDDTEYFVEALGSGAELSPQSPILHLRRFFLKNTEKREKPRQEIQLAMWCKAWNAYRDGVDVQLLSFKQGGKKPEPFPRLK